MGESGLPMAHLSRASQLDALSVLSWCSNSGELWPWSNGMTSRATGTRPKFGDVRHPIEGSRISLELALRKP